MADKQTVKVGDKVRCLVTQLDVCEGATYEVNNVFLDGDIWIIDDVGDRFYLASNEFELLPVAEATGKPALAIETGKFYRTRDGRKVGPMRRYNDGWLYETDDHGRMWRDDGMRYYEKSRGGGSDLIAEWIDEPASNDNAPATKPAIVALIENGQPKPSEHPKVHKSGVSATDEAERLAVKYPGQKFGVFVLADSRIADVVIRRAA
ncbi:hypothetical protein [Brucella tritici]|uniref:hypothetical protein n=1 Tax=Brucella tritici TaxID=94626 RepID=UPI003D6CABF7